ncbi:MAG: mechanosensitive ion channel [Rhodothermales bacterium]
MKQALLFCALLIGATSCDTAVLPLQRDRAEPATDTLTVDPARIDSLFAELAAISAEIHAIRPPDRDEQFRRHIDSLLTDLDAVRSTFERAVPDAREQVELPWLDIGRIVLSFILLIFAAVPIKGLIWMMDKFADTRDVQRQLSVKKFIPVTRVVLWVIVVYAILHWVLKIDSTGLISAWAGVGVAVGFASQDVLKNIIGGLILIFDKPFQEGDKISVGGTYGTVKSIGLRSTRIVTPDDNLVAVPNAQVVEDQVANANAGEPHCQVVTDLYLPTWVDVMEAKAIAYSAAANSRYVYLDKPIVVNIKDEYQEGFLTHIVVKAYVIRHQYEFALSSDITETAKAEFQRRGMLPRTLDDQAPHAPAADLARGHTPEDGV